MTRIRSASSLRKTERMSVREDGGLRLAVVADTHSVFHADASQLLSRLRPDWILHAGDIGAPQLLDELGAIAPVLAVRGNIDPRAPRLPDVLVVEIESAGRSVFRILLLHVGLAGLKLRAEVAAMARAQAASIVVCGHSHVPFIGREGDLWVFNPGSMGPRRFGLPIVFGMIELSASGVRLSHVDVETGQSWQPPRG